MSVSIEIHGVEEVQKKLDQVARDVKPALVEAMGKAGTTVQKAARAYSPVDTGWLRASIVPKTVVRDYVVESIVGSDVRYAAVQEKRVGFLRRALADNVQKIIAIIDRAIVRIVEKK